MLHQAHTIEMAEVCGRGRGRQLGHTDAWLGHDRGADLLPFVIVDADPGGHESQPGAPPSNIVPLATVNTDGNSTGRNTSTRSAKEESTSRRRLSRPPG